MLNPPTRSGCSHQRSIVFCLVSLLSIAAAFAQQSKPAGTDSGLGRRIVAILETEGARQAHWGIQVVSVKDGKELAGWNQDKLFIPGSTAKLFTIATALVRLGPNFTVRTTLETSGALTANGRLNGDLVLVGRGDPNLSGRVLPYRGRTERTEPATKVIEELADQVLGRGVRSIEGDLVADDRYFVSQPYGQGWEVDDLMWWYGAPVSALAVNDNVLFLNVRPGAGAGEPALAWLEPSGNNLQIESHVATAARGQPSPGGGAPAAERRLAVDRRPGSTVLRLWGQIPADDPGWQETVALDDPPRFAAEVLRQQLDRRGIQVTGSIRVLRQEPAEVADRKGAPSPPAATPATVLASHESAPLAESLKVITKVSQNLHAEMLLRTLGRERRNVGSVEAGLEEVNQFLMERGIGSGAVNLKDGSGLSRQTLVTPSATVALLRQMVQSEHNSLWYDLLPIAGTDGTLTDRLRGPGIAGRVRAKTGSLTGVAALAGYAVNRKNQLVAFAIFVNHHTLSSRDISALIDRMVEEIAKSG